MGKKTAEMSCYCKLKGMLLKIQIKIRSEPPVWRYDISVVVIDIGRTLILCNFGSSSQVPVKIDGMPFATLLSSLPDL